MKKNLLILTFAITMIIATVLTGCGKAKEDKNTSFSEAKAKSLITDLLDSKIFVDELSEIDSKISLKQYDLDESKIKNILTYKGGGATAEEITIIESEDEDYINEKFDAYIENQIKAYEEYMPAEVKKIKDYVKKSIGNYTIIVISDENSKVEEMIEKHE